MPEEMAGSTMPPRPFRYLRRLWAETFSWSPFQERVHLSANGRLQV